MPTQYNKYTYDDNNTQDNYNNEHGQPTTIIHLFVQSHVKFFGYVADTVCIPVTILRVSLVVPVLYLILEGCLTVHLPHEIM